MRTFLSLLILFSMGPAWAQDPGAKGGEGGDPPAAGEAAGEEKAPEEPPAWTLPDRDRRAIERLVEDYLVPGRLDRPKVLEKMDRVVGRDIDGHSALEDVPAFVEMANKCRVFNPKLARRGRILEIKVKPEVHQFPGGIGTVAYTLYVPKDYSDKKLWPAIFCLPDNKKWASQEDYIKKVWLKSEAVADGYLIAVPAPDSKGESWSREKSQARAMISLRHLMGTYDAEKSTAGPATDMLRVFVDGDDGAAETAARFAEMFAGAILRHSDGKISGGPNLRQIGGLAGLPAYCIVAPKKKWQAEFAKKLRSMNDACLVVEAADGIGDAAAIAAWMDKLPARTAQPRTLEYTVHDQSFQRHYWINVLDYDATFKPAPWFEATADRARNVVRITVGGVSRFELSLNDAIVDLNRDVKVIVVEDEREYTFIDGRVERNLGKMLTELVTTNHPWRVYPVQFDVDVAKLRNEWQAAQAAKKAEAEKGAAEGKAAQKGSSDDA
jgi:hypothetical protein